jgi:hypothetical protein
MVPYYVIRDEIARFENEVEIMNEKADDLLAEVNLLRTSIQDHQAHIARLNSQLAPIGALSPEVLGIIFQSGPTDVFKHETYVMSISQVCQHWRNISLATPSLWSYFRIPPTTDAQKILEMFLERSRSHPLSIVVDVFTNSTQHDNIYPPLDRVVPLISRWHTLCIRSGFWEDVSVVCSPFKELHAPLLESFTVVVNVIEDADDYIDNHLQVFKAGAPKLSHVRVEGISLLSCLPPLTSLVLLDLDNPPKPLTPDEFRRTVTASNQLRHLSLRGDVADIRITSTLPAIELPSLRSLWVSTLAADLLYNLLVRLKCPALEDLTIGSSLLQPDILPYLVDVLRDIEGPSYPLLQSLTLQSVEFARWWDASWITIKLPSITRIVLEYWCTNSQMLLKQLLPLEPMGESNDNGSGSVSWPLLQTIGLSSMTSAELETLCDVISNRISRGTPLVCVQFDGTDIPADRLEWLQARLRVERFKLNSESFTLW